MIYTNVRIHGINIKSASDEKGKMTKPAWQIKCKWKKKNPGDWLNRLSLTFNTTSFLTGDWFVLWSYVMKTIQN